MAHQVILHSQASAKKRQAPALVSGCQHVCVRKMLGFLTIKATRICSSKGSPGHTQLVLLPRLLVSCTTLAAAYDSQHSCSVHKVGLKSQRGGSRSGKKWKIIGHVAIPPILNIRNNLRMEARY